MRHKNQIFLSVLTLFFLASCGGKFEGRVFLDADNNQKIEDGEDLLVRMPYHITKDGKTFKSGKTDDDGRFEIELDGAGTYCLIIDDQDLMLSQRQLNQGFFISEAWALGTGETLCNNNLDDDQDGDKDCLDSDCKLALNCQVATETVCADNQDNDGDQKVDCNDSDCSNSENCKAKTETNCSDNKDDDGDKKVDCDDSDCDKACAETKSATEEKPPTIESGKVCFEAKEGLGKEIDVPVIIKFDGAIPKEAQSVTAHPGDTINFSIIYPTSCEFNVMKLDENLTPTRLPAGGFDEGTHQLNLNPYADTELPINTDLISQESSPLVINVDKTRTVLVSVVLNPQMIEEKTLNFNPTMECPGKQQVKLTPHEVVVKTDDLISMNLTVAGLDSKAGGITGEPDPLETVTVNLSITSNQRNFSASDTDLQITVKNISSVTFTKPGECTQNTGNELNCDMKLETGKATSIPATFTFPELTDGIDVTFNATLKILIDGKTREYKAEQTFKVPGKP